ncbi:MAG: adenylyltransferase/cytidyltransferase family protein [Haloarculaceae archaeon]
MTRVMAQGAFDVLHPGHVHYLSESAALGDELVVVLASDERVASRKQLYMDEESRREVVDAVEVVEEALVGNEGDIYDILDEVDPDVVTIGYDQDYDLEDLRASLAQRGYGDIEVVRVGEYDSSSAEQLSSSRIKASIFEDGDVSPAPESVAEDDP